MLIFSASRICSLMQKGSTAKLVFVLLLLLPGALSTLSCCKKKLPPLAAKAKKAAAAKCTAFSISLGIGLLALPLFSGDKAIRHGGKETWNALKSLLKKILWENFPKNEGQPPLLPQPPPSKLPPSSDEKSPANSKPWYQSPLLPFLAIALVALVLLIVNYPFLNGVYNNVVGQLLADTRVRNASDGGGGGGNAAGGSEAPERSTSTSVSTSAVAEQQQLQMQNPPITPAFGGPIWREPPRTPLLTVQQPPPPPESQLLFTAEPQEHYPGGPPRKKLKRQKYHFGTPAPL